MGNQSTVAVPQTRAGKVFATTHWSVVLAAAEGETAHAGAALEVLCRTYWYPVYAYMHRRGCQTSLAQDLTQEFFARLLTTNWLNAADPHRGRFRSFLLASVQHFLNHEREKARAIKRGGAYSFISLDEETAEGRYRQEPACELTPEKLFERRWALGLLEKAMAELERDYAAAGKARIFEALQSYLSGERNPDSYAEAAARAGMSEGAARVAVHRLRRRYGELLRSEVAHTVATPAEVEDELRHIRAALSN